MVKKLMFHIMLFLTSMRFCALAYMLTVSPHRLPVAVLISSGIIVWIGIGYACRTIIKSYLTRRELQLYYILAFISITFNLIVMKLFSRVDVQIIDLCVTGTLLELVVFVTLWIYSRKERMRSIERNERRRLQHAALSEDTVSAQR